MTSGEACSAGAHETHTRQAHAVARALAEITGSPESDPLPLIVAHTLLGAHRAPFLECHRRLGTGEPPATVARELEAHVHRVYELLEYGLTGAATSRPPTAGIPESLTDALASTR